MCTVDYDMFTVVFWIDTLCSTLHIPLELDWSSLYIWVEWFPTPVRPSGSHLKQRLTARVPRCTVCTGTDTYCTYLPAVCIRWRFEIMSFLNSGTSLKSSKKSSSTSLAFLRTPANPIASSFEIGPSPACAIFAKTCDPLLPSSSFLGYK